MAGFIALLNVAVITVELGEARVKPSGGVTEVTVGGVSGSPGFPAFAFLSKSAHPATKVTNMNAANDIFPVLNLHISFSCSAGDKAFLLRIHGRRTLESLNSKNCVLAQIPMGVRIRRELGMSSLSLQQARATVRAELLAASFLCDSRKFERGRGPEAKGASWESC